MVSLRVTSCLCRSSFMTLSTRDLVAVRRGGSRYGVPIPLLQERNGSMYYVRALAPSSTVNPRFARRAGFSTGCGFTAAVSGSFRGRADRLMQSARPAFPDTNRKNEKLMKFAYLI